ncbi:MAG: PEP-CTERM sorting domain-containing protein [Gemmatimonadaceae bacterium]|nr:PEP-CTERM sorting domain-containing protein [Gemmatimonadaceae bacterium]
MRKLALFLVASLTAATQLHAQLDFSTVTTGSQGAFGSGTWYQDRYAPGVFQNTTWQSRNDVLQIGIREADNMAGRGGAFSGAFYSTQGRKFDLGATNSARFFMSAELWVDNSWADAANGFRRTDMWGVGGDCVNTNVNSGCITAYPIIGFTNRSTDDLAFKGFRYYDNGVWVNTSAAVNYGAWNSLAIELDVGSDLFTFYVNGTSVGTSAGAGTLFMDAAIMQAYNFSNDFSSTIGANNPNGLEYNAYWANTSVVPEPSTYALMALGLAGLVAIKRRRQRSE